MQPPLQTLMLRYMDENPRVSIELVDTTYERVFDDLSLGLFDLVVLTLLGAPPRPGIESRLTARTPVVCAFAQDSDLAKLDELTPHLHLGADTPEGPRSHLSRTAMLALAVTIHNLPEGMAVGVVFAGADQGAAGLSVASALAVSIGIAIQNVPEGAIISMPMRAAGNSKWRSFLIGSLSGAVEPIGGLAVVLLASLMTSALPYLLAFAAGAMFYVVVEELIPEASEGKHSNLSTIGFAIGFVLMMVLDVLLG